MTRLVVIVIPLVVVWAVVLFDIGVRGDLSVPGKLGWIAAITLLWPTMILYLLLRPVHGRLVTTAAVRRRRPDERQQLVVAVLDHQAGRSSDEQFRARIAALRRDDRPTP